MAGGANPGGAPRVVMSCLWSLVRAYGSAASRLPADLRHRRDWRNKALSPEGTMELWLDRYFLDTASLADLEPQ